MHNQLSRGQLSRALKLAVGDRRSEGGLERFGETLQPTIDLWALPEWAAYRDEQLAAIRTIQGAIAAEFGGIALCNPLGSNLICVVEAVSFTSSTGTIAALLEMAVDTVPAATWATVAFPAAARDRRFKGATGTTRCFIRQGTDPALNTMGAQLEQRTMTAVNINMDFATALPVIVRPGDDLLVIGQTVNSALQVNWAWRERQAYPGELG